MMNLSTLHSRLAFLPLLAAAGLACIPGGARAQGQEDPLADLDIQFTEAKMTLQSAAEENAVLRAQVKIARQQVHSLTESLAIANSESEIFKRQTSELKLRMEALGLDAASPDKSRLEQRLLKAVSDLKIVQSERDTLAERVARLSEAIVRYLKNASSTDGDARMAIETEMRGAAEAVGVSSGEMKQVANEDPANLTDGRVISVKEEFALVVANLGRGQGVKTGMPFQVWRGNQRVATVRVVDVRDKISGAVIQDLNNKEKIKVGDRLRVDARL